MYHQINEFETDNNARPVVKCPFMSDPVNGWQPCITDHCAMWISHISKGKDTGYGHCGLSRLPFTNVVIQEESE